MVVIDIYSTYAFNMSEAIFGLAEKGSDMKKRRT